MKINMWGLQKYLAATSVMLMVTSVHGLTIQSDPLGGVLGRAPVVSNVTIDNFTAISFKDDYLLPGSWGETAALEVKYNFTDDDLDEEDIGGRENNINWYLVDSSDAPPPHPTNRSTLALS
ncbi:hypothetical protein [Aeromonas jandaei]|uniref:hypothetical protein n=1 Tax=Aeromonas jandaei TaxID=650 RepID=UPI003EC7B4D7